MIQTLPGGGYSQVKANTSVPYSPPNFALNERSFLVLFEVEAETLCHSVCNANDIPATTRKVGALEVLGHDPKNPTASSA